MSPKLVQLVANKFGELRYGLDADDRVWKLTHFPSDASVRIQVLRSKEEGKAG